MFQQRPKVDVVEKFKILRSIYDKIFILIAGSLWIFATIWDIYKLQRYWLDYSIEFYTSFLIFYMIIYSINQKALPAIIYNSFRIISTIRGRGVLLIIISTLFLNDKHAFHKYCAILFLIGGIIYFICEILVPTTKEELQQIESIYNSKTNITNNDSNINNTQTINNNYNIQVDQSTAIFKNNDNNKIMNNNINTNNNFNNNEKDESNNNVMTLQLNEENKKNEEGKNEINNINEEIIRKTDNPYEIPEDF